MKTSSRGNAAVHWPRTRWPCAHTDQRQDAVLRRNADDDSWRGASVGNPQGVEVSRPNTSRRESAPRSETSLATELLPGSTCRGIPVHRDRLRCRRKRPANRAASGGLGSIAPRSWRLRLAAQRTGAGSNSCRLVRLQGAAPSSRARLPDRQPGRSCAGHKPLCFQRTRAHSCCAALISGLFEAAATTCFFADVRRRLTADEVGDFFSALLPGFSGAEAAGRTTRRGFRWSIRTAWPTAGGRTAIRNSSDSRRLPLPRPREPVTARRLRAVSGRCRRARLRNLRAVPRRNLDPGKPRTQFGRQLLPDRRSDPVSES